MAAHCESDSEEGLMIHAACGITVVSFSLASPAALVGSTGLSSFMPQQMRR